MGKSKKDTVKAAAGGTKSAADNLLGAMESGTSNADDIVPFHKVVKKEEMSRAQKEWLFIVKKIEGRLVHLLPEASYDQTKGICGIVGFLFLVAGGVMCLKALSMTVLFASDPFDFTLLVVGGSFGLPCVGWFVYIFIWPHLPCSHCRNIKANRNFIHKQRSERKDPGLFNEMVAAANKDSEPPIIRTRLFAMWRKHEITIVCHTMQEFQEIVHFKTGVKPDRQLIKLREPDGSSYVFDFKPDEFILDLAPRGVVKDTLFWLYCKGAWEVDVESSPSRRMKIPRTKGSPLEKCMIDSVNSYITGPQEKDVLETELDDMLDKELADEIQAEAEEKVRLEEEEANAEAQAELDKLAEEEGGFLTWLSPFKKERKKTPEELEAEES